MTATGRILTPAEILGITGDEPPLTDADIRAAIRYDLGDCWRGEWLLAGGDRAHQVRTSQGGCAGWLTDHYSMSVSRSRKGLLIRVSEHPHGRASTVRPRPTPSAVRAGRISWRTAEAVLRQFREPAGQGALFDLAVSA